MLTSIDPFVQEFDRLAQRVFGWNSTGEQAHSVMPMDAIRRPDEVVLRFDLPGIDPESMAVTVDRGVLTVSANRSGEYAEGERPFIRERVSGTFTRRVYLPETLDSGRIEAAYQNGVLAVRVPVLEQAKPRKIEIITAGKEALQN